MIVDRIRELSSIRGLVTRAEADNHLSELRAGVRNFDLDFPHFSKVVETLKDPELDQLVEEGRLSIGLVKARAYEGRGLPEDDDLATKVIISQIGSERLMFQLPWKFTRGDAAEFYAPLYEPYRNKDQEYTKYGDKVWASILNHASSGASTILLIGGDNAIDWWREKMGKTRPDDAAKLDPTSIRGKLGLQEYLPNNLVHGSDHGEVARELFVIRESLKQVHDLLA